ncbi:MAG: hypothetical protein KF760_10325 [Candidatus Eremiobacteraeota bacterium]|nr:hypothetical protein [Candidatus Eremiobacteraeota bacterium]MCW5867672.1 hypothetical protein [Candidatus Eremiobacteraeota bacterium]
MKLAGDLADHLAHVFGADLLAISRSILQNIHRLLHLLGQSRRAHFAQDRGGGAWVVGSSGADSSGGGVDTGVLPAAG